MKRKSKGTASVGVWLKFFDRNGYLLFLLAPLTVMAVATLLFEISLGSTENHIKYAEGLFKEVEPSSADELQGRYLWMVSCVALVVTSLAAIVVSIAVIRSHAYRFRFRFLFLALALASGQLLYFGFFSCTATAINFSFTLDLLETSKMFDEQFLSANIWYTAYTVVSISIIAAMFLFVAASTTVILPVLSKKTLPYHVAMHMVRLRNVLYVGSIMLITGVLNMGAWMRWPAAMLTDTTRTDTITDMALGVSTYWGASFTLMAMAAYIPAAVYLRHQALTLFREQHSASTMSQQELWLKEQGLTMKFGTQTAPILAMIGPVLASPLGAVLNTLTQQLNT